MINSIIRYFDLQSSRRTVLARPQGASDNDHAPVLPQYAAVAAGVIAEPWLQKYIESGQWSFDFSTFSGRVIFGLIIGFVILPGIYKSSFDPSKPVTIQLAALFTLGIGWQTLFSSATKLGN